jgi:hypothetical protein
VRPRIRVAIIVGGVGGRIGGVVGRVGVVGGRDGGVGGRGRVGGRVRIIA